MQALSRLTKSLLLTLLLLSNTISFAQYAPAPCPYPGTPTKSPDCHPYPQPRLSPSTVTKRGDSFIINTGQSLFPKPEVDPFTLPPGTNFLPSIYTNMYDSAGNEMLNTLPSTPQIPYNLHDGDPVVTPINDISPTDDLREIFEQVTRLAAQAKKDSPEVELINRALQRGLTSWKVTPSPNVHTAASPCCTTLGQTRSSR